jgi:O-antigen ligase
LSILIYLLSHLKAKKFLILVPLLVLILFVLIIGIDQNLLQNIFRYIWDSIFLNYDTNNLNSFSAGRIDTYISAINFSIKNPLLGLLNGYSSFYDSSPHNYILFNLVNFGIVGSFPFIIFYLYIFYFALKKDTKINNNDVFKVLTFAFIALLVISNLEYTYPFGPGVSQLMVWFLMGQLIKEKKNRI